MATFTITNRMKRAFIIPGVFGNLNQPIHAAITLNPGQSMPIDGEHWASISKGNTVIEALLTGRNLVVNRGSKEVHVDPEELSNPKQPSAPEELKEKDERVQIDSKVELKEVELKDNGPTEGKGKK